MKKICLIILLLFLLPNKIYAAESNLSFFCPNSVKTGEVINCTLKIAASGDISGVQSSLEYSSGIEFVEVSSNFFTVNYQNKTFLAELINVPMKSGDVAATFKFKIKENSIGTQTITLSNNKVGVEEDGNTQKTNPLTQSININVLSNDATLSSLKIDGSSVVGFDSSISTYNISNDNSSVVISAIANNKGSNVNGLGEKKLNYGLNTFDIVVTSESGVKKTYTLNITRKDTRSNINTLKSLSVSGASINFNETQTTYDITVESETVKVNSELKDTKSSYVTGYGNRDVKLSYGLNKVLIKVKAENGEEKTYTLNITRKEDIKEDIKSCNINQISVEHYDLNFDSEKINYYLDIEGSVNSLKIDIQFEDSSSTYEILGNENLVDGSIIKIVVNNDKSCTKEYFINIKKNVEEEENNNNNQESKKNILLLICPIFTLIVGLVVCICFVKKIK